MQKSREIGRKKLTDTFDCSIIWMLYIENCKSHMCLIGWSSYTLLSSRIIKLLHKKLWLCFILFFSAKNVYTELLDFVFAALLLCHNIWCKWLLCTENCELSWVKKKNHHSTKIFMRKIYNLICRQLHVCTRKHHMSEFHDFLNGRWLVSESENFYSWNYYFSFVSLHLMRHTSCCTTAAATKKKCTNFNEIYERRTNTKHSFESAEEEEKN